MGLFGKSKEEKQEEWYTKGEALSELGQYEESIVCFDKALEINTKNIPTIAHAWYMKSQSFFGMKLFDESLTSCDEAIRLHPSAYRPMRCTILLLLKRYEEVVTYCDEVISSNHGDDSVLNTKGIALMQLERNEEAITCFDNLLASDKSKGQLMHPVQISAILKNKGVTLKKLERYEESVLCFNEAITLNPEDDEAVIKRDNTLADQHRARAHQYVDNMVKQQSFDWCQKGIVLCQQGRNEEAITCFDEAILLVPKFLDAWTKKGNALKSLGRDDEAMTCYEKAITCNPEYEGYDENGYDENGYDENGYNKDGYDENGYDKNWKSQSN
jgi:tetratricopeptide (TPR) repeat protein